MKASERAVELSDSQRVCWLRLIRSENVGPATFRSLINHFGSAEAALEALPALARRGGSTALSIPSVAQAEGEIERTLAHGARLVAISEPLYPAYLRQIAAPPPLVTIRGGSRELFARPTAAIVGSRNASLVGHKMAERIGRGLGEAGFVVVSGLARGIDGAAHRASLDTGTVAVIAGGIDHVYPEEHGPLMEEIVNRGGAVLTEMPFGWNPRAKDFPRRNRIVSGMSLGVVVVEAAARSGTLHTARYALDQGREVFAVPGSPMDPRAEGTNRLIRDGATLTRSADDVIAVLRPMLENDAPSFLELRESGNDGVAPDSVGTESRASVINALGPAPVAIDEVILHTGLPAAVVSVILLELDLAGRIERHGGQLVSLIR
ncbi:DNA-processing protein DprA [Pleomorphomonas sp. NRK KF1]|uniref:DNA-processing protein DprA n=1 Tax=Pleomorphomonas sp. NRK KF1 TaxID=2943000 RepID=UPI002043B39D|nr:DNA-processing protein DprA [Pleomorphomonas sp. NRK KF1]MCM5552472.1 DNA-processing protein DprA [Pleomorphomonas sp. NRK KF1]